MLITATESESDALLGFELGSDGQGACYLGLCAENEDPFPVGAGKTAQSAKFRKLSMNGKEVFRFATSRVPQTLNTLLTLLQRHDIAPVDWLLLHQANRRIMDSAAKRLGMPQEDHLQLRRIRQHLCSLHPFGLGRGFA